MNLLLDTHVLLWSLAEPERLPADARSALESRDNQVWVSAISVWEAVLKAQLGKLEIPEGWTDAIGGQGMDLLPFSAEHALALGRLPPHHRDPFDRALIAQCLVEDLRIMTADKAMLAYEDTVPVFRV